METSALVLSPAILDTFACANHLTSTNPVFHYMILTSPPHSGYAIWVQLDILCNRYGKLLFFLLIHCSFQVCFFKSSFIFSLLFFLTNPFIDFYPLLSLPFMQATHVPSYILEYVNVVAFISLSLKLKFSLFMHHLYDISERKL